MTTERANQAIHLMILSLFLSGCASSGAPAPVEQRRPTANSTYTAPSPGIAPQSAGRTPQDAQVQITALGDDSSAPDAQASDTVSRSENMQAQPTAAPRGSSPAAAEQGDAPASGFAVANPAVVALLNRANRDASAGRQGASAASLERAIKIEPGNAWLWHRLAQTRLKQNQPGEAASIAARSNALAGNDDALRARNWRLIARAHRLRGEAGAAQAAQRTAERLERGAS